MADDARVPPALEDGGTEGAVSLFDRLAGETEAEHWLHASARATLLNLLLADPTVVALFDRWRQTTALGQTVDAYLGWLERTALVAGIDPGTLRSAIREAMNSDGNITLEVANAELAAGLTAALHEGVALLEAAAAALENDDLHQCSEDAIVLVRDTWRLPYPWLSYELCAAWVQAMLGKALGEVYHVTYTVELTPAARPAPAIAYHFATKPGETIEEAWERFLREAAETVAAPLAEAAHLPRGRRTDGQTVRRYVEWWYRRHIRGESIRAIAGKNDGRRKLVRYGIEQAERWLSVANCVWKSSGEADRELTDPAR